MDDIRERYRKAIVNDKINSQRINTGDDLTDKHSKFKISNKNSRYVDQTESNNKNSAYTFAGEKSKYSKYDKKRDYDITRKHLNSTDNIKKHYERDLKEDYSMHRSMYNNNET